MGAVAVRASPASVVRTSRWDGVAPSLTNATGVSGARPCSTSAAAIAAALIEHGRAADTPVAVVSDGATPSQRLLRTTLAGLAQTVADEQVRPPAVWVVGEVVSLGA